MGAGRTLLLLWSPWILSAGAAAQEETSLQAVSELIRKLDDSAQQEQAAAALVALGEPAVPVLLEALRAENPDTLKRQLLEILEAMGPAAADAPEVLWELLFQRPGNLSVPLMQTLGELLPYSDWDISLFHLQPGAPSKEGKRPVEINKTPIPGGILVSETERFVKLLWRAQTRSTVQRTMTIPETLSLLGHGKDAMKEWGIDVLLLQEASTPAALPILEDLVREERRPGIGAAVRDKAARAFLKLSEPDQDRTIAHARLLVHGRLAERMRAALMLREPTCRPQDVVPKLVKALGDRDVEVVREVVVTLGIAQPSAEEAGPALAALLTHTDKQVVERARAVLRQIKRR